MSCKPPVWAPSRTLNSTDDRELSVCQLCRHWRHRRLLWQPPVPPVTTKLASWRLSFFSEWWRRCIATTARTCRFLDPVSRRLQVIVRSRKVSKPRDFYLELSDRFEIWQVHRQHCCRCACQISKRCNLNYQSRGFETSRDLTIRRLIRYWNGALDQTLMNNTFCRVETC